jgi:hypothetical protein
MTTEERRRLEEKRARAAALRLEERQAEAAADACEDAAEADVLYATSLRP